MTGMVLVLGLCEAAVARRSDHAPHLAADRLRHVADSAAARTHRFIEELGARRLGPTEVARLFPTLPQLCRGAGLQTCPEIYLYSRPELNAFALGDKFRSAVLISEGLVTRLSAEELTGVLAHELGHIVNGDARLLAVAAELNQMVGDAAVRTLLEAVSAWMTDGKNRTNGLISTILVSLLAPVFSCLLQCWLSRIREYDADRIAADLMGQPFWLVAALQKLNHEAAAITPRPASFSHAIAQLLRSHPHGQQRIERLLSLTSPSPYALAHYR
jgi:heat shock protein HtpX